MPHVAAQDDVHNGYFIPKGSIVVPNIWCAIYTSCACVNLASDHLVRNFTHDPARYHEPMEFKPERFLERCTDLEAAKRSGYTDFDPESKVFGFGGR